MKNRVVGDGAITGNNVEGRAIQPPPRLGDFAIGHEAVVDDIAIFLAFRPLTLEIERITCSQKAGARHDLGL